MSRSRDRGGPEARVEADPGGEPRGPEGGDDLLDRAVGGDPVAQDGIPRAPPRKAPAQGVPVDLPEHRTEPSIATAARIFSTYFTKKLKLFYILCSKFYPRLQQSC